MRAMFGLLLIVILEAGAPMALAAPSDDPALAALNRAAFGAPGFDTPRFDTPRFDTGADIKTSGPVTIQFSQGQGAAPLSASAAAAAPLAADALFAAQQPASPASAHWRVQSASRLRPSGAVDTVNLTVSDVSQGPGGLILAAPNGHWAAQTQSLGLGYDRAWPSTLSVAGGRYDIDLSPHAGLAMADGHASAVAGASLRFQLPRSRRERLASLGFSPSSSSSIADKGRWFLFAEGSGELVGMHLSRDGHGLMPRAALTLDDGVQRDVVSDTQAGIGWRKGGVQASFGYVHREIRNEASIAANHQTPDIKGDMLALTFSLRSR